ncbi:MAG: Ig-like domain-containing protein [Bacteroidales bacterium]|nr:Ig-like domain-containing protein [Bacteroidales bacterium]MCM1146537.1 Ig-like domain-containing protein [Bacteroidales bacterium]MCM1205929.1 Ig-like domain-containing protein [Bacillota bacterium]MCM1510193.1 Ig-like domain-containing protein [Clostridium sp.]
MLNRLSMLFLGITGTILLHSCARMGAPDGGWYDEVPPRVVATMPQERATGVTQKRLAIYFNEFIQLDNATENIVICPPQIEQPDIKTTGKSIRINLRDSLKANTTYTIDFSDAIKDNNENNPMGNYTFVFSTGDRIDTLAVSGYVVNAEDLEPVKGQLVGLYSNLEDSAFTTEPMLRTGRTDADGHFVIRGVAPGKYRIYALGDSDGNFMLSQRGEPLAFSHEIIVPSCKDDIRQDTIWKDSLHIADIRRVPYVRYVPDDICLRSFTQTPTARYLIKAERKEPNRFTVYFSTPSDTLPELTALNFNDKEAYVIETTEQRDTITYWLRDTALVNQDTLRVAMRYMMTDSLGTLVSQTDTIDFLAKVPYEKRMKFLKEDVEKWEKALEKAQKKNREFTERDPRLVALEPKYIGGGNRMSPDKSITVEFPTPIDTIFHDKVRLYTMTDTMRTDEPLEISSAGLPPRTYAIRGEWRPATDYILEIDSAAFRDIYGKVSDPKKFSVKIAGDDEFSSLFVNVEGVRDSLCQVIVQLLDRSGKQVAESIAKDNTAEFYYLLPGTYYMRCILDRNRNGKWDTGDYSLDLQPEEVYYNPKSVECKAKWDLTTTFSIGSLPFFRQKPAEMRKQKREKKQTIRYRNAQRAAELGLKYDREKVNSKF